MSDFSFLEMAHTGLLCRMRRRSSMERGHISRSTVACLIASFFAHVLQRTVAHIICMNLFLLLFSDQRLSFRVLDPRVVVGGRWLVEGRHDSRRPSSRHLTSSPHHCFIRAHNMVLGQAAAKLERETKLRRVIGGCPSPHWSYAHPNVLQLSRPASAHASTSLRNQRCSPICKLIYVTCHCNPRQL